MSSPNVILLTYTLYDPFLLLVPAAKIPLWQAYRVSSLVGLAEICIPTYLCIVLHGQTVFFVVEDNECLCHSQYSNHNVSSSVEVVQGEANYQEPWIHKSVETGPKVLTWLIHN